MCAISHCKTDAKDKISASKRVYERLNISEYHNVYVRAVAEIQLVFIVLLH